MEWNQAFLLNMNDIHFRTNAPCEKYEVPYSPQALGLIVPLLFIYKDGFGFK